MKGKIASLIALFLAGVIVTAAWAVTDKKPAGPTVEVVGLAIAKAKPQQKDNRFVESRAKGLMPGTQVYIEIADADKTFINLDKDASAITAFADDKGTELLKKGGDTLWDFFSIADDGHAIQFMVKSNKLPAADARSLTVKGKIALTIGSDLKTGKQDNVALKKGTAVKVGSLDATIKEIGSPDWGQGEQTVVEFQSNKSFDAIRSLTFLDANGKEIESQQYSSGSWGMMGKITYTRGYSLTGKVAGPVTIKVNYYDKIETVTVPLDLTVGVGL